MDLSRITAALGFVSALSTMVFTGGMAVIFKLLGPYLAMGAHIYAFETEPQLVDLPFPTLYILLTLVVAGYAAYRSRKSPRWSGVSVGVSLIGFLIEVSWFIDLYAASAPAS